jgi:two-component system LytT family response regulator
MTIRTIIVDDEPLAREGIRLRLASEPDIEVVGEYGSAREAMEVLDDVNPDLLFLDVQMPGKSGIDMLHDIGPDRVPAVILVTAYEEHALDAFEVSVVDYVLKPIDTDRFQVALDRARVRLERVCAVHLRGQIRDLMTGVETAGQKATTAEDDTASKRPLYTSRFLVSDGEGEIPVNVSDIDWIEAAGDYVRLHVGDEYHLVRETMARLERSLDPGRFARIHRGTIVQLDRVEEIFATHHGDADVRLTNGTVLKLSRSYRDAFRRAIGRTTP